MNTDSSITLCKAFLYMEHLPLINAQFALTNVHTSMYILRTHSKPCIIALYLYVYICCIIVL